MIKTYKCLKGIKKNSESCDGNPDGTEMFIFSETILNEEIKQKAKEEGLPSADKMYFVFVENPILVEYVPISIIDFKVEIISNELTTIEIKNETIINYLESLEEKVLNRLDFKFYE